jgi:hypothetical protein
LAQNNDNRTIECTINGDFIGVILIFSSDNGFTWSELDMNRGNPNSPYIAILPAIPSDTKILFYFKGITTNGDEIIENNQGQFYSRIIKDSIMGHSSLKTILPPTHLKPQLISTPSSYGSKYSNNTLPNTVSISICQYCKAPLGRDFATEYEKIVLDLYRKLFKKINKYQRKDVTPVGYRRNLVSTYRCQAPMNIPILPDAICQKCAQEVVEKTIIIFQKIEDKLQLTEGEKKSYIIPLLICTAPIFALMAYSIFSEPTIGIQTLLLGFFPFLFCCGFLGWAKGRMYRLPLANQLVRDAQLEVNQGIEEYISMIRQYLQLSGTHIRIY